MDFTEHVPVMLRQAISLLLGDAPRAQAVYVDATFGGGGYTQSILERSPGSRVVALDADPEAVLRACGFGRRYPGRVLAIHSNFAELSAALDSAGIDKVDGMVFDLGLSSLQLADTARGFSFLTDQPLDMRLDPQSGDSTAADMINTSSETEIAGLLQEYGGERHHKRIARAIVEARSHAAIERTDRLAEIIARAVPSRMRGRRRLHPATRTFQALRIAVNSEPHNLGRALVSARERTRSGGRIVVVSFHSGEDRIVKQAFREWHAAKRAVLLMRKPLRPDADEIDKNRRSRSARLRAVQID